MVEIAIFGFLGAALSLHSKVFVLVPVMLFTFAGLRGESNSWVEIASVLFAVQLGYFAGGILQYLSDEKSRREIQPRTHPQVDPAE
jgi:hypothetical protein